MIIAVSGFKKIPAHPATGCLIRGHAQRNSAQYRLFSSAKDFKNLKYKDTITNNVRNYLH